MNPMIDIDPNVVAANADRLIDEALHGGEGLLSGKINARFKEISDALSTENRNRKTRGKGEVLTDNQIQQQAEAILREEVKGEKGKGTVRELLVNIPNGEAKKLGLQDFSGAIRDGSGFVASVNSGSILGIITSLPALVSNSVFGDSIKAFITAIVSYFGESDPSMKDKSFFERIKASYREQRFDHANAAAAEMLGVVNPESLKQELLKPLPAPGNGAETAKPGQGLRDAGSIDTVASLDHDYDAPNGTLPGAPSNTPAPGRSAPAVSRPTA